MQFRFFQMFALLLLAGVIGAQGCAVTYAGTHADPESGSAGPASAMRR